jgi:predicted SAM-dependent methyltransferase
MPCDIRRGLPAPDDSFDYAVSIHALEQVPYLDAVPVLRELRRVLRPDGVLRLGLPDLDRAVRAYVAGEREYFLVPDDEVRALGGKLSVQMTWYGSSRLLLTYDFVEELLLKAGFRSVRRCEFGETASPYPDIVELDNRRRESFFAEAVK